MTVPEIPRVNVRKVVAADVHAVAAKIENKPGGRPQTKVDEFLRPLLHSSLGRTQAYTRMKAVLEYQSRQGKDPEDFVREMVKQSKEVMRHHRHELLAAEDYLRALRRGNNFHRLKKEVLMPLQTRSISPPEAWSRVNSFVAAPYGQPRAATNVYQSGSNPHGSDGSGSHGSGSHGSGSHGSGSHGSGPHGSTPPNPNPPSSNPPSSNPPSSNPPSSNPPSSNPPGSQSGGDAPNEATPWSKVNSLVAPSGQQNQSSTLSGIGGTIGIGGSVGGSTYLGGAVTCEILGARYRSPAFYTGVEVSLGVQGGVAGDIIVDVGFCSPKDFGGWYIGIGGGVSVGVGFVIQVTWALPPLAPHYLKEVVHEISPVPQGFSVGVGVGEEVEVAAVVGGGQVSFWDSREKPGAS